DLHARGARACRMSRTRSRPMNDMARVRSGATAHARRDLLTGAITMAAILLFVLTGSQVLRLMLGHGMPAVDPLMATTLLLNIALILFGWRRYRDLTREVTERTVAEERAQILASKDPLTGFLNRRSLAESGAALMADGARRKLTV